MSSQVSLRPIEEADLPLLLRFVYDRSVAGEFEWFGFRVPRAKELQRRWPEDGLLGPDDGFLAVALEDGSCAGWVNWRKSGHFGNLEFGISLFAEHRGHGVGTEAQRQLIEHLFGTTTAYRLSAITEVDNFPEQKALERVGFRREGVQRGLHFRAGLWRDGVMYGLLRTDSSEDSPRS